MAWGRPAIAALMLVALSGCSVQEQGEPAPAATPSPAAPTAASPDPTRPPDAAAARFRCVGNEPGWTVEIRPDSIVYVGEYGEVRVNYPAVTPRTGDGLWFYETQVDTPKGRSRLSITIAREPCSDGMSDREYEYAVRLIHDFKAFFGCAQRR